MIRTSSVRPTLLPSSRLGLLVLPFVVGLFGSSAASSSEDLSFEARTRVLAHWIDEHTGYHEAPGLVLGVVDEGELVWSHATGWADRSRGRRMSSSTRLRMGSVSKIFTSTLIVQLRDRGLLDLDDPVREHLPWFRLELRDPRGDSAASVDGERWAVEELDGSRVTVRHLLTHTGGLPREAAVPYWTDHVFPDSEQLAEAVQSQSALWPPGREYQYSNLGMGLLGEIAAAVTGGSYAGALEDGILAPLGMDRTTADPTPEQIEELATGSMRKRPERGRRSFEYYDTGALAGAANVVSTLDDMARFAALHLRSRQAGRPGAADAVVAPRSLQEMQTAQWTRDSLSSARGLGFSVTARDGRRVASHGGWIAGHRSHLILVPEAGVAVMAMVNADDTSPSFFAYEALDVLLPAILARRDSEAADPAPASTAGLEGTYSDPWGWYYEVMELDGDLYFYEHGYPPSDDALSNLTRLEADDEGGYHFGAARDPVRFERDADGRVVRVLRRSDYLFPVSADGAIRIDLP